MRLAFALVLLTLGAALASEIRFHARGGKIWQDHLAELAKEAKALGHAGNSTARYYTQLIDHDHPSRGTYRQKFYVDSTYYKTGGPVMFYIGGEGPVSGTPTGYVATVAQQQNGLIVALEHRFYGESLPLPLDNNANYAVLTVEQALQDAVAFIHWFSADSSGLNGVKAKWISIGGSYPGALSAWIRQKYPHVIHASWSSSGVVAAVYNFTAFDQQVAKAVGLACTQGLRSVMAAFDAVWGKPEQERRLYSLFNAPADMSRADFAWMLADSAAMGPQYGYKADMCRYVYPISQDPLARFADWTLTHYGGNFSRACYYNTACLSDASRADKWANERPWIYQCCNQLAYWQVAYPGAVRSQLVNLRYFEEQCDTAFKRKFDQARAVADFNRRYGGFTPSTTRVIALNGADDPWQPACIQKSLNSRYLEVTAHCPGCGHCVDLSARSDWPQIVAQHEAISKNIAAWLQEP